MPSRRTEYTFKPPTPELTYLAQLQEWADCYSVQLTWADGNVQTNGKTEWQSYPVIQGCAYASFAGKGPGLRAARQVAAEMIVKSPGTLHMAKSMSPPPTISQTR